MRDLFLNGCILVSFVAVINQFIKEIDFNHTISNLKYRIIGGIICGLLGCILMLFSVEIMPGVIFDYRTFSIILASTFGGFITSIVTSIIIGIFRICWFGLSDASIISFVLLLICGIGCPIITYKVTSIKKRYLYSSLFTVTIVNMAFIYLLKDNKSLIYIVFSNFIGSFILISILLLFINNLVMSNQLYKKYRKESSIDYLTGLNNVRAFERIYKEVTKKILEKDEKLSVLMIDIDNFKIVNDTYGHFEGDIILRELSKLLLNTCRDFDIISRNGGEEFSVLLIDCYTTQAIKIAERIRTAVEQHKFILSSSIKVNITISVGIATFPDNSLDVKELLREADKALYEAKQKGRNRIIVAGDLNEN